MSPSILKIDPNLNLGLHELANTGEGCGTFRFRLRYAERQIEDILLNLDNLVQNTIDKAPMRTKDFCLNRTTDPPLTHEEDKWERAIMKKWGREGADEYVPVCERIQTYQYPLQASRRDTCWGKIDLLGIGPDFRPVPNELKKREATESPLKMLVEVAAYGFAIRKVWPNLKDYWVTAVSPSGAPRAQFPASLDRVTLVGVAPREYWLRSLGQWPGTKAGQFPAEAWPPFWELVDALGRWFNIHFVTVDGIWNNSALPILSSARVFDLRSESGRGLKNSEAAEVSSLAAK